MERKQLIITPVLALAIACAMSRGAHLDTQLDDGSMSSIFDWGAFPAAPPVLSPSTTSIWDPDGDGPGSARLLYGGTPVSVGRASVWQWEGSTWTQIGSDFMGPSSPGVSIHAIHGWTPPNRGSSFTRLIAAGKFRTVSNGVEANHIAQWDGAQWAPLGPGINADGRVRALAVWDPDGTDSQLIVAGLFSAAGGAPAANIARWDGQSWHPLGAGLTGSLQQVSALTVWDPDGDGPAQPVLVAGGQFTEAGGNLVRGIAMWNGIQWLPIGGGFDRQVELLTTWDPDGDGPEPNYLVAAGQFSRAGSQVVNHIAVWDGAVWSGLDGGLSIFKGGVVTIAGLASFDPDGPGPLPRSLVVSGYFDGAGDVVVHNIAMWDGTRWNPMGRGLQGGGGAMILEWPNQNQSETEHSPRLVAAGSVGAAGCAYSPRMALWGVQTRCPGDSNRDGVVNFADLNDVLGSFGFSSPHPGYVCADINNDGVVNFADLNEVLGRFGLSCD